MQGYRGRHDPPLPNPSLNALLTHQNLLPKHSTRTRKPTRITVLGQLLTHTTVLDTTLQILIPRFLRTAHLLHITIARALLAARLVSKRLHGAAEAASLHDAFGRRGGHGDGRRGLGASLDRGGFSGRR